MLKSILARVCSLRVKTAEESVTIEPGTVYVARPDLHLMVRPDCTFAYQNGHRRRFVLSSANPVFESAAHVFGPRLIAVVLTVRAWTARTESKAFRHAGARSSPRIRPPLRTAACQTAALATGVVDRVLPLDRIAPAVVAIVMSGSAGASLN
jgi:two-component system, chemotaxis family, protein-glutamate methylesterase/glutaminase